MSDTILTFQVQLSAVMETVLKSAMYEITRLVEDSFMEEVARSKQEVDALRQRLQWSESKHREREDGEQTRCVDCGRVRASSKRTKDRSSGRGAETTPHLHLSKGCSEPEWSPSVRQDTAPSSGSLLPEQQSSRQGRGESCVAHESEVGQEGLSVAGRQRSDPHLQRLSWTAFKLGDSDSEAEGLDPSCASVPEPASPPTRRAMQPRPAEEGAGLSASPLQHLSVKSEGGVPEAPLVKEEAELQPVCREEMDLDTAHGESWDRGDLQVEHTASSPPSQAPSSPPQTPLTPLRSFTEKSLTLQFPPHQQRAAEKRLTQPRLFKATLNPVGLIESTECTSYHRAQTRSKTNQSHNTGPTVERPYSCTRCGKSFSRLPYLKEHMKIHTGEKPFSCVQCGRGFTKLSNLKVHRRVHTGERPYVCTSCGKRFTLKSNLKRHHRIHTGVLSF